jgi:hypothetical protein
MPTPTSSPITSTPPPPKDNIGIHPEHEAVRQEIVGSSPLPDPAHHGLKQLPAPHLHWLRRILLGLLILIVGLFVVFSVGYLRFGWQKKILLLPAKVLPFPVAIVNGTWLSYYDYQTDTPKIAGYLERYGNAPDTLAQLKITLDQQARKVDLNKIFGETILMKLAKQRNITIEQKDVDTAYDDYVKQSSEPAKVGELINTLYGWTEAQFKEKVVKAQVIQNKLAVSYFADIKTSAEQVRARVVKDPATFSEVAKTESQDATAVKGGEVSPILGKNLTTEYGDAKAEIEKLKKGDISPVLETSRGYEFVKLVDRLAETKKGDGDTYKLLRIVKVPNFNVWLQDEVNNLAKTSKVYLFEPRFRWEAECGVLLKSEPSCTDTSTTTNANTNSAANSNTNQ